MGQRAGNVTRTGLGFATLLGAFPLHSRVALVMQPDEASREPPLHRPTQSGSSAPTVRVATTHTPSWIVDALGEASGHVGILPPVE
jgi:hypothetical protein